LTLNLNLIDSLASYLLHVPIIIIVALFSTDRHG